MTSVVKVSEDGRASTCQPFKIAQKICKQPKKLPHKLLIFSIGGATPPLPHTPRSLALVRSEIFIRNVVTKLRPNSQRIDVVNERKSIRVQSYEI